MANSALPQDSNNVIYEGVRDPSGQQFVAKAAGVVTTDAGGVKSAPQVVQEAVYTDTNTSGALAADLAAVAMALPGGQATALFQITGTFVGTLLFQASADGGTTWVAVNATSGSTVASSATAAGDWRANIAGYTNVRVEMHPYTSGTASVRVNLSAQPHSVVVTNAQPLGQNTMANSAPVVIASNQSAVSVNLAQVGGAALTPANPAIVEPNTQTWLRDGQMFSATTAKLVTAAASLEEGACLFNPAASGKSLLVYSCRITTTAGSSSLQLELWTTNPAYPNTVTPLNLNTGSAATSIATITSAPNSDTAGVSTSGSVILDIAATINQGTQGTEEMLSFPLILAPGHGLGAHLFASTSGTGWGVTYKWVEF